MAICSAKVRCTPCEHCMHYYACMASREPASALGRFLAWLSIKTLPKLERALKGRFTKGLKLKAMPPYDYEGRAGAFAVVAAYEKNEERKSKGRLICRVRLTGEETTYSEVRTIVINAILKAYLRRERKNQK